MPPPSAKEKQKSRKRRDSASGSLLKEEASVVSPEALEKSATQRRRLLSRINAALASAALKEAEERGDAAFIALCHAAVSEQRVFRRAEDMTPHTSAYDPDALQDVYRAERWAAVWAYLAGAKIAPIRTRPLLDEKFEFVVSWQIVPAATKAADSPLTVDMDGGTARFTIARGIVGEDYEQQKSVFIRRINDVFFEMEERAAEALARSGRVHFHALTENLVAYLMLQRGAPVMEIAERLSPELSHAQGDLKNARAALRTSRARDHTRLDRDVKLKKQIVDTYRKKAERALDAAQELVKGGWQSLLPLVPNGQIKR